MGNKQFATLNMEVGVRGVALIKEINDEGWRVVLGENATDKETGSRAHSHLSA